MSGRDRNGESDDEWPIGDIVVELLESVRRVYPYLLKLTVLYSFTRPYFIAYSENEACIKVEIFSMTKNYI